MIDFSQELVLIDKPVGITSFDVIRRLRRRYSDAHDGAKAPKLGHAGTLDPLATGLMLIGVGRGTKKLTELTKLDKEYVAEVRIGESRTTGDLEGDIVAEKTVDTPLTETDVLAALGTLLGTHEYVVSAYSAIKKDGIPMYKRARKAEAVGEQVSNEELPRRAMTVYEAELLKLRYKNERAVATVRFSVGSGTYIRSLGEVLGEKLGYPACLQALRRTRVGEYQVADAVSVKN